MVARGTVGVPNMLSVLRMALSLCLIPLDIGTAPFITIYFCTGLTDVLDGWIARRTGSETELGARLDTIGDTALFVTVVIKVLTYMDVPLWAIVWIILIFAIKSFNIVYVYARRRDVLSEHTVLNKLAGLVLFALPLAIPLTDPRLAISAACLISAVAALHETYVVCRTTDPERSR